MAKAKAKASVEIYLRIEKGKGTQKDTIQTSVTTVEDAVAFMNKHF